MGIVGGIVGGERKDALRAPQGRPRRESLTELAVLLAAGFLVCLILAPAVAQAARVHSLLLSETLPNLDSPRGAGVDSATHHFYVVGADSSGQRSTIYNFEEDGRLDPLHPELTGAPSLQPFGLAVDNSSGGHAGYIYATNVSSTVQQFDPEGKATGVSITAAAIPPNNTAQAGGLPPVVNKGSFEPRAVAVDGSGDVYVTDSSARAIDVFNPAGGFVRQVGAALSVGFPSGIAVDGGHIYLALSVPDGALGTGLFEIDASTGECIPVGCAPIDNSPVRGVAVDRARGKIFTTGLISEEGRFEGKFSEYEAATGELLGVTQPKELHAPFGIAVDETSGKVIITDLRPAGEGTVKIFGPEETVPDVKALAPEAVTDRSVTLKGEIGAAGVAGGANCVFQYADQEEFEANGFEGTPSAPGRTAPCQPPGPFAGEAMNAVTANLTGLRGGTTYHERIVGTNANGISPGEDIEFTTSGPTVTGTKAVGITEGAATIVGTIDPRGLAGSYVFQYLTQASFEAGGWGGAAEIPAGGGNISLSAKGTGDLEAGKSGTGFGVLNVMSSAAGTGDLTNGSPEITALNVEGGTFEVGAPITGAGIPPGTTIKALGSGTLELSNRATSSGSSVSFFAGSRVVSSLNIKEGEFEVGMPVAGAGIPAGATITALGPGSLVLSAPAQAAGSVTLAAGSRVVRSVTVGQGAFGVGQTIVGPGIPPDTKVIGVVGGGTVLMLSADAGQTVSAAPLAATAPLPVSQAIAGLSPGTAYRFRILATTAGGETAGQTASQEVEFTAQQSPFPGLPDERAYEQVSPTVKNGANIQGGVDSVQASLEGNGITFFSDSGIPGGEGSQEFPTFMARHLPDGWSAEGLLPPASFGPRAKVLGWTEDLEDTYDFATRPFDEGELLLRTGPGALTRAGIIASQTNSLAYAGSSQGGAVALLESKEGHLKSIEGPTGDVEGKQNVYAYDHASGELVVAGVMDDGSVPAEGTMAGPYDWYQSKSTTEVGGAMNHYYTQSTHAISADGSKIFFTVAGTGQLYVRINPLGEPQELTPAECREPDNEKACTIQVSAPQGGPGPEAPAAFVGASADGRLVYFLDKGRLTSDATGGTGYNLYRYEVTTGSLVDLSLDTADRSGARVEGMLGIAGPTGEDAYFVAAGKLVQGTPQEPVTQAPVGETNLYRLHGTAIEFVARLGTGDEADWIPRSWSPAGNVFRPHAARVSADGLTLLFSSARQLTSYENRHLAELYLFRVGAGIICISCNPSGEAPTGAAGVQQIPQVQFSPGRTYSIMTRNLSPDGRRVFFDSPDRLVAADHNDVNDVYEWEADGEGSCTSTTQDGGCLFLISGGAAGVGPSWFGDADEEGNNVFFFTAQPLVGQDRDELVDLYDARIGGVPQNPTVTVPCEGEAGCRGPAPPPPAASPSPGSEGTFRENPKPPVCKKGQVLKNGKCVKKPKKQGKKNGKGKKSKNKNSKKKSGKGKKGGKG